MHIPHINFQPMDREGTCAQGGSILDAAHQAEINLASICGGRGTCGRCLVQVVEGEVSLPSLVEKRYLGSGELDAGFRLACQAQVLGDLKVNIPPESLTVNQRFQVLGEEREILLEPMVQKYAVSLPQPTLEDLLPDRERLLLHLKAQHALKDLTIDFNALRHLPPTMRAADWHLEATVRGGEVIDASPQGGPCLGVATDLGTTKIAFYLVNLKTGQTLDSLGTMNPQVLYGEDVMSRIAYVANDPSRSEKLSEVAIGLFNETIGRMCDLNGFRPEAVFEMVVVGNTAMHHLLLQLPVEQLGTAPYLPAVNDSLDIKARDLDLHIAPGGYIHLLPNIAGFVGADHVAMILASGIHCTEETVLGLDIGTNTEVVIAKGGELVSCSCASGPAFEGAHIVHGMRAASGAIERVRIEGQQIRAETIDDYPAVGICGSGILDAVAELYRAGIINYRGRMQAGHPLVRCDNGRLEVALVTAEASGTGKDIVVSQEDINQIQLAKGAIRTGINHLLRETNTSPEELEEVILAGAFGTYILPESAVRIGMFPPLPLEKFRQVGNAAGMGAKLALISRSQRSAAQEIARRVRYLELMSQPDFMEDFAFSMYLPH